MLHAQAVCHHASWYAAGAGTCPTGHCGSVLRGRLGDTVEGTEREGKGKGTPWRSVALAPAERHGGE